MKAYDYRIITRGDFHVLVIRDEFTTGVYTCNEKGVIIPPGNRLLKTHLTYEQNFVTFRHITGKMNNKIEHFIGSGAKPGTYFGAVEPRVCHKMEVVDSLKRYDDEREREYIYANDEEYEIIDGSHTSHMNMARAKFHNLVELVQQWLTQDEKIYTLDELININTICGKWGCVNRKQQHCMRGAVGLIVNDDARY